MATAILIFLFSKEGKILFFLFLFKEQNNEIGHLTQVGGTASFDSNIELSEILFITFLPFFPVMSK